MLKDLFLRTLVSSKLKNIPESQREKIISAFSENPELFTQIAQELKEEMKNGKDQMSAAQEVLARHQEELKQIMND